MANQNEQIELEVRRILSSEDIQFRQLLSEEAASYREFLQRQFKQTTLGISVLAAVGAALFVWFFSDSVDQTQTLFSESVEQAQSLFQQNVDSAHDQLEKTVDAKVIDYFVVDELRERLVLLVKTAATSESTVQLIDEQVRSRADEAVSSVADDIIKETVRAEISKIENLDVDALLQKASLPRGALLPFVNADGCPAGWTVHQPSLGRFLLGSSTNYSILQTGGEAEHVLTVGEMPTHAHEYKTTDNGPLHDNPHNFISSNGRFGLVAAKQSGSAGAGQPHNNMPPYVVVNYCVKS